MVVPYTPPNFCFKCGKPFPWTAARIEAAKDLAGEIDELTAEERDTLKGLIPDLAADTPKTELAAHRYKKILGKISDGAQEVVTSVVTKIATEAAKEILF